MVVWRLVARWLLAVAAASALACAQAHEFKLDAVINAFVKVEAHEAQLVVRAPLYLFKSAKFSVAAAEIEVDKAAPGLERALAGIEQDITLYENGKPLVPGRGTARLSLPSDRSFESYDEAVRHVAQPLERGTRIFIDQGYVDARISYPLTSPGAELSLRTVAGPELGDALKFAVRYMPADGESRAMVITRSSGTVALNPGWAHAAAGFTGLGIVHILSGYDHLLFLLCLLIPLRGWRQILGVITVFTIAHSFTLLGSAFHLAPAGAWFPPFVEAAIAASIVYMALENIVGVNLERRVLVTGLFGLIHGFGFSYGLSENFQFAGTHLLVSLFAFNVGIELGQFMALAVMIPALALVRRHLLPRRVGMIVLSALVAHTGWHWMLDRGEVLWRTAWPRPGIGDLAVAAFWLGLLLLAAGALTVAVKRLGLARTGATRGPAAVERAAAASRANAADAAAPGQEPTPAAMIRAGSAPSSAP